MLLIAQGIAGSGVLQTHGGGDITGVNPVDILPVVGVHLHDTAHTLVAVLHRVVHSGAGFDGAGVDTEEAQLAHEGVGGNLEGQSGEGLSSEECRTSSSSVSGLMP
mgnify:CR=1 FL=1